MRKQVFVALVNVRRLWIAKVFAACLVTLTVTPFTAPFSTYAVADLLAETTSHASADCSMKLVQEDIDPDGLIPTPLVLPDGLLCLMASPAVGVDAETLRPLVLRI